MSKAFNPQDITNKDIVRILREALAAMEVKNANRFRIRAYQNAISEIANLTSSVVDLWENNRLGEIPGVGGGLSQHLKELFTTGKVQEFIENEKDLPQGMFPLIGLRGVGSKTAFKIASAFKLNSRDTALEEVKKLARAGEIQKLSGFGEKSEKEILDSIEEQKKVKNVSQRMLFTTAEEIVERYTKYMIENPLVESIEALGSFRRKSPTVGDIDFAIVTSSPAEVLKYFSEFGEVKEVLSIGDKKASVVLKNDTQVDAMATGKSTYGSLLQHFTGSKLHNIELRKHALDMGMSLSENGIKINGDMHEFDSEADFYSKLDLEWIPPEIRHGKGEIEAAQLRKLPKLVDLSDIKGDLHMHTVFSDGRNTLEEMVNSCIQKGYEYVGIADHAPSVASRGSYEVLGTIERTRKMIEQINSSQSAIRVLYGYEVNILVSAELGMPDEYIKKLDYAIGGIHTGFNNDKTEATKRIISAIENPFINIIAHISGRIINSRDPLPLDYTKIFDAAVANDKVIEINSQPDRLDLADDLVKAALDKGVKIIINTDAHATEQLDYMKYGVYTARRGWAQKSDIINTNSFNDFKRLINLRTKE